MTSVLVNPVASRLNNPTVHTLPNGLRIIAEQMPVEVMSLDIWARVGSAVETDAINGVAHFLEHMVFKGTDQLKAGEFERRVEERGAVMNAATSQDYTHFYITCAPQDFATLAPLQLDLVFNPSIPDSDFASERHVVLEEIRRAEDNPQRRTYTHMVESTFDRLPYRRSVLGPSSVIENITPQEMRDFYRTWYQPQNLTIVAVGNLPVEAIIETIVENIPQAFHDRTGAISPAPATSAAVVPEPAFTQIQRHEFTDPTLQQARMMMTWRVPGLQHIEDTYPLDVLSSVMSHGRTSRLVQDLRETRSLVTSISAGNTDYWAQGIFTISARLKEENIEQVEAAVLAHIRELQVNPVKASELNRIRTQVANRFVFGNERPSDRTGLYGYYQTLIGDLEPAFNYPDIIRKITAADVQEAALRYLPTDAYSLVIIRPEKQSADKV